MYPFLSAPSPIKKTWLTWFEISSERRAGTETDIY